MIRITWNRSSFLDSLESGSNLVMCPQVMFGNMYPLSVRCFCYKHTSYRFPLMPQIARRRWQQQSAICSIKQIMTRAVHRISWCTEVMVRDVTSWMTETTINIKLLLLFLFHVLFMLNATNAAYLLVFVLCSDKYWYLWLCWFLARQTVRPRFVSISLQKVHFSRSSRKQTLVGSATLSYWSV